jgi:hypothetical protein
MSVSQQLSNISFFNLIAAIRQTELGDVLREDTYDGMQYSSLFNFNISDINDNVCLNTTSKEVISDEYGKLFNPLDDIILREPSISSNLETLVHHKCNIMKSELYTSIRNPGIEASIQPDETSSINAKFLKEGESITVLNPKSSITLPSEFRQYLYENTKNFNQYTPYCIVYGTFTPKNKGLYHVSAAIVCNGHLYPFGWTNEKVLDNPRDKTVRPVQAVLVSPETINPRWNYFIIDILLVTNDMLTKIENFFDKSTLKVAVDLYQPYTEGLAKDTLGIIFGENHLYVDKRRYTRVANNFTQVCFGFNCSSWIEYIFGINCRMFSLSIMPSIPNYCKRAGYKSKFKEELLHNIIQSIRNNNFSQFFQLINNTKVNTKNLSNLSLKSNSPAVELPLDTNNTTEPSNAVVTKQTKTKTKKAKTLSNSPNTASTRKTRSARNNPTEPINGVRN